MILQGSWYRFRLLPTTTVTVDQAETLLRSQPDEADPPDGQMVPTLRKTHEDVENRELKPSFLKRGEVFMTEE